jgi:hypothetical protein
MGQHSWVVLGGDCYNLKKTIVDVTLYSYVDDVPKVLVTSPSSYGHRPHGYGSIWRATPPSCGDDVGIELTVAVSTHARTFLKMYAERNDRDDIDARGWMGLANAPVLEWPAAEIIAAMDDTDQLRAFVPIDRLGMLTDRNPGKLYR